MQSHFVLSMRLPIIKEFYLKFLKYKSKSKIKKTAPVKEQYKSFFVFLIEH